MARYMNDADGFETTFEYDSWGQLKKRVLPTVGGVAHAEQFVNNARGDVTLLTDIRNKQTSFEYNKLRQLTKTIQPGNVVTETVYDDPGNVFREIDADDNVIEHAYNDDNQIATFNGLAIVPDAEGNMTSGPLNSQSLEAYTYDTRNRLTGAGGVSYGYDPLGNRIKVTEGAVTYRDVVNSGPALSQLLERRRTEGGNTTQTFYVYGLGLLYQVDGTENTLTYHYDLRGSTVATTDLLGNVIDRLEYSSYGRITRAVGPNAAALVFTFNGRYGVMRDANGLHFMRARYYKAYLRRFVNPNPIGFSGGMNWYAYANGDPVSLIDPFGLEGWIPGMFEHPSRNPFAYHYDPARERASEALTWLRLNYPEIPQNGLVFFPVTMAEDYGNSLVPFIVFYNHNLSTSELVSTLAHELMHKSDGWLQWHISFIDRYFLEEIIHDDIYEREEQISETYKKPMQRASGQPYGPPLPPK